MPDRVERTTDEKIMALFDPVEKMREPMPDQTVYRTTDKRVMGLFAPDTSDWPTGDTRTMPEVEAQEWQQPTAARRDAIPPEIRGFGPQEIEMAAAVQGVDLDSLHPADLNKFLYGMAKGTRAPGNGDHYNPLVDESGAEIPTWESGWDDPNTPVGLLGQAARGGGAGGVGPQLITMGLTKGKGLPPTDDRIEPSVLSHGLKAGGYLGGALVDMMVSGGAAGAYLAERELAKRTASGALSALTKAERARDMWKIVDPLKNRVLSNTIGMAAHGGGSSLVQGNSPWQILKDTAVGGAWGAGFSVVPLGAGNLAGKMGKPGQLLLKEASTKAGQAAGLGLVSVPLTWMNNPDATLNEYLGNALALPVTAKILGIKVPKRWTKGGRGAGEEGLVKYEYKGKTYEKKVPYETYREYRNMDPSEYDVYQAGPVRSPNRTLQTGHKALPTTRNTRPAPGTRQLEPGAMPMRAPAIELPNQMPVQMPGPAIPLPAQSTAGPTPAMIEAAKLKEKAGPGENYEMNLAKPVPEVKGGTRTREVARRPPTSEQMEMDFEGDPNSVLVDHYGNQEGIATLDPAMMGTGQPGAERASQQWPKGSWPEYSFTNKAGTTPETRFENSPQYRGAIEGPIYDVNADPLGLKPTTVDHPDYQGHYDAPARQGSLHKAIAEHGFQSADWGKVVTTMAKTPVQQMEDVNAKISPVVDDDVLAVMKKSDPKGYETFKNISDLQKAGDYDEAYKATYDAVVEALDHGTIDIAKVGPAEGHWTDPKTGKASREFSVDLRVKASDPAILRGRLADVLKKFNQKSGIISRPVSTQPSPEQEATSYLTLHKDGATKPTTLTPEHRDTIAKVFEKAGLGGAQLSFDGDTITLDHIPQWSKAKDHKALAERVADGLVEAFPEHKIEAEDEWMSHDVLMEENYDGAIREGQAAEAKHPVSKVRPADTRGKRTAKASPPSERHTGPRRTPAEREAQEVARLADEVIADKDVTLTMDQAVAVGKELSKRAAVKIKDAAYQKASDRAATKLASEDFGVEYSALMDEFLAGGKITISDLTMDPANPDKFFAAAQLLRNTHFEVAHFMFVEKAEGGKYRVIGSDVITQKLLQSVEITPKDMTRIRDKQTTLGADGVLALHNHPTRIPLPSDGDVDMATSLLDAGIKIIGSGILDNGTYTWMGEDQVDFYNVDKSDFPFPERIKEIAERPDPLISVEKKLGYAAPDVYAAGKAFGQTDSAIIFYTKFNDVVAVASSGLGYLEKVDPEALGDKMTELGGEAVVVLPAKPSGELQVSLNKAMLLDAISDYVYPDGGKILSGSGHGATVSEYATQGVPDSVRRMRGFSEPKSPRRATKPKSERAKFSEGLAKSRAEEMGYPNQIKIGFRKNLANAAGRKRLGKAAVHDLTVTADKYNVDIEQFRQWYREEVPRYLAMVETELPGISSDSEKSGLLNIVLALTSPGARLEKNFQWGVDATKGYLNEKEFPIRVDTVQSSKSDELALWSDEAGGRVPEPVGGMYRTNVMNQIRKLQDLIQAKEGSVQNTIDWLMDTHSFEDFEAVGLWTEDQLTNNLTKSGEFIGAEVFGPKVSRYFENLQGVHTRAVYDRWFSFWAYSHLGNPVGLKTKNVAKKGQPKKYVTEWAPVESPRSKTDWQVFDGAMTDAAVGMREATGEEWGVDELQAGLWFVEKAIAEEAGVEEPAINEYTVAAERRAERRGYGEEARDAREKLGIERGPRPDGTQGQGEGLGRNGQVREVGPGDVQEGTKKLRKVVKLRERGRRPTASAHDQGTPGYRNHRERAVASEWGDRVGNELLRKNATTEGIKDRNKPTISSTFNKVYADVLDDMHPIHVAIKGAVEKAGGNIQDVMKDSASHDPYTWARFPRASVSLANDWLKHGVPDHSHPDMPRTTRGLEKIFGDVGKEIDVFQIYLESRHIPEREALHKSLHEQAENANEFEHMGKEREKLERDDHYEMKPYKRKKWGGKADYESLERARQMVEDIEATLGGDVKKWQGLAEEVTGFHNAVSQYAVNMGQQDQPTLDLLVEAYPSWVPLWNIQNFDASGVPKKALGARAQEAWGHAGKIDKTDVYIPITEAATRNTEYIIRTATENRAKLEFIRAARDLEGLGDEISGNEFNLQSQRARKGQPRSPKAIRDYFEQYDVTPEQMEAILETWRESTAPIPGVISAMENGKKVHLANVDEEVWQAFSDLQPKHRTNFKLAVKFSMGVFRAGITLAFGFAMRQGQRDPTSSIVISEATPNPENYRRALKAVVKHMFGRDDPVMRKYINSYASMSSQTEADFQEVDAALADMYANGISSMGKKIAVIGARKLMHGMAWGGKVLEYTPRVAVYDRLQRKDMERVQRGEIDLADAWAHSGLASRGPSSDFQRGGRVGRELNDYYPFFNPTIQGGDEFFRAHRRGKTWGKGLAVSAIALSLWWAHKDEEWYQKLTSYQRFTHFWLRSPKTNEDLGVPTWIAPVAKPYDVGHMYASFPEFIANAIYEKDPEFMREYFKELRTAVRPIDDFTPTPTGRALEGYRKNYDSYRGRELVGAGLKSLNPELQYNSTTTEFSKWLAQIAPEVDLGIVKIEKPSPIKLDHFIRNTTGTLGADATKLLSELVIALDPDRKKARAAPHKVLGIPVESTWGLRDMFKPAVGNSTHHQDRLRGYTKEAVAAWGGLLKLKREGAPESTLRRFIQDDYFWVRMHPYFAQANKIISKSDDNMYTLLGLVAPPEGIDTEGKKFDVWKRDLRDRVLLDRARFAEEIVDRFENYRRHDLDTDKMQEDIDVILESLEEAYQAAREANEQLSEEHVKGLERDDEAVREFEAKRKLGLGGN